MTEKEEWDEIKAPNEEKEIEIEIEEEEVKEEKPEAPELEGIETKGAEKRIRQLIRQRKERDEQISTLIQKNEELFQTLRTKDKEVSDFSKLTLDASEKQLTDKIQKTIEVGKIFIEEEKQKIVKEKKALNITDESPIINNTKDEELQTVEKEKSEFSDWTLGNIKNKMLELQNLRYERTLTLEETNQRTNLGTVLQEKLTNEFSDSSYCMVVVGLNGLG